MGAVRKTFPSVLSEYFHQPCSLLTSAAENTPFSLQVTKILSAVSPSLFRAVFIGRGPSLSVYTQKTISKTIFLHVFMFFVRNKHVKLYSCFGCILCKQPITLMRVLEFDACQSFVAVSK